MVERSTVPYDPELRVAPDYRPTPEYHEETPLAAFGGLTAAATEHFGEVEEGAGKELVDRGLAIQQMHQQSAALEAVSRFSNQVGDLQEQLHSKQGKDAADFFPQFKQQINDTRDQIRAGLSSPYAQFIFDQDSRSMQAYVMRSAGAHVGDQEKAYAIGAYNARRQSIIHNAPLDEIGARQAADQLRQLNQESPELHGKSQDEINYKTAEDISKMTYKRLLDISKTQPFTARKMADEAYKEGRLFPDDYGSADAVIMNHENNVEARNGAELVMSGAGNRFGDSKLPLDQAATGIKAIEGGNYTAVGVEAKSLGHALGAYSVMSGNLSPWLREAGMPAMSEREFLSSPNAQDQLFRFKFGQYMNQYGSFNRAAAAWFTGSPDISPGALQKTDAIPGRYKGVTLERYLAVANGGLAKDRPLDELVSAGRDWATTNSPTNPALADHVEQNIIASYNREERVRRDEEQRRKQVMAQAFQGDFTNGKVPDTFDHMIHVNPEVETTYNSMKPSDQIALKKQFLAWQKADQAQTSQEAYTRLSGLASSRDSEEVDQFLNTDLSKQGLSRSDWRDMQARQHQLWTNRGGDVAFHQMMANVLPMLRTYGIDPANKDLVNQFRGEFNEMVYRWREDHPNKPLEEQTYKEMAAGLLQRRALNDTWWQRAWGSKDFLFRLPLPSDKEQALSNMLGYDISAPEHVAEKEMYRQEFIRQTLNEIQRPKAGPTTEAKAGGGSQ